MNISLILIGSELLNGKIQDKNTQVISQLAFQKNHQIKHVFFVADEFNDFSNVLDLALKTSDIVLTSGGLGPTKDDLTMDFLAKYFDCQLEENQEAIKTTLNHYERAGRIYDIQQSKYRFLPKGFKPLNNPAGFAPGLFFIHQDQFIFSLPGVPREFEEMVKAEVLPLLNQHPRYKQEIIQKNLIIKTKGLPEEAMFKTIAPELWQKLEQFGSVSSLPHFLGVDIGIHLKSTNQDEILKMEQQILQMIQQTKIQEHIWHIGPETLEELIVKKAREKKLTFGFAESCTGGLNSHRITNISGCSSVFWGSVISYDNQIKKDLLNVNQTTLDQKGAVSTEVALEMSAGLRNKTKLDITIATTGIAGPSGGTPLKPVGTVCISFCDQFAHEAFSFKYFGDRETLKNRFSIMSLFILLERINLHPGNK